MKKNIALIAFMLIAWHGITVAQQLPESLTYLKAGITASETSRMQEGQSPHLIESATVSRSQLKKAGLQIRKRLSFSMYIVEGAIKNNPLFRLGGIQDYGVVNHKWKLPNDWQGVWPKGVRTYWLTSPNPDHLLTELQNTDGVIESSRIAGQSHIVKSKAREGALDRLSATNLINSVTIEHASPIGEAKVLDMNLTHNRVKAVHHHYPELTGKGVTISIQEQMYDSTDIDISLNHIPSYLESTRRDNHATEMATIIGGQGNTSLFGQGVAKGAGLTSSDNRNPVPDTQIEYQRFGVSIQNHSYGRFLENFYGSQAQAFDQSVVETPTLLHVFSSGNKGDSTSVGGIYDGIEKFANLSSNYKMAKNMLLVAATDTLNRVLPYISRGPAYDGRIKPELTAYGVAGSSNAAALVSGTAALMQQAYQDQYGELATSALLKALLINTAEDIYNEGPDFITGFGNVDALSAMRSLKAGNFLSGEVDDQGEASFSLEVPEGVKEMKVTLVWADPASEVNSAVALVNDLDMEISDNGSGTWRPWILNTAPNSNTLLDIASRGEDHLNNVEQIGVDSPTAGIYNIKVKGFDIPQGPQKFYIAYQFTQKDQFEWVYPTRSDNAPFNGETTGYFSWNESFEQQTGELSISYIEEGIWRVLSNNIDLSNNRFRWEAPNRTSFAQLKMKVGDREFLSDTFSISRPLRLRGGFNCGDSLKLYWQPSENAVAYQLYNLKDGVFQKDRLTTDTIAVITKSEYESPWFIVAPVASNGRTWIRSDAVNYNLQGNTCYIQSLFAENIDGGRVRLLLNLNDLYNVESAVFGKEDENGVLEIIGTVPNINSTAIEWIDELPKDGDNVYQAQLRLKGDGLILSNKSIIFMVVDQDHKIFPNPLVRGEGLRVFSKNLEVQPTGITLYDSWGRLVWKSPIFSDRAFVRIPEEFDAGIYYYAIDIDGEVLKRGKLILQ